MKCGVCDSTLRDHDGPPVQCSEYLIADPVFAGVEELLGGVNRSVELERWSALPPDDTRELLHEQHQ
jgi:hypothetical protein